MSVHLILASGSQIRADLLRQAQVPIEVVTARVDEDSLKSALLAEAASPRDIADTLAETKARRVSQKHPGAWVLGCDQVLDHKGQLLSKPESPEMALSQLADLQDSRHSLLSAAVIVENGQAIWRHVGQVRLRMRPLSESYRREYVARNWQSIRHAVGAYKLEEEGSRLFSSIEGSYFDVLGLPLLPLLNFLTLRGVIDT